MKNLQKLGILFFSLLMLTISSCKKEEIDIRDQYVGTWNFSQNGSITLYYYGDVLGTSPLDENGTMVIEKVGDDYLLIGGKRFRVDGDRLSADPEPINEYGDNGVIITGTETANGRLGSNLITLESKMTGTWKNAYNESGNFSGKIINTLTK